MGERGLGIDSGGKGEDIPWIKSVKARISFILVAGVLGGCELMGGGGWATMRILYSFIAKFGG